MIKTSNIRDFLLLLIAIYSAQGGLYSRGSIISQTSLLLLLLISGVYFFKTLLQRNNKNLFYKAATVFVIMNIIGAVFLGDITDSYHFGQLKNTLLVYLPFYPFYYFAQKGILDEKFLRRFFIVILFFAIMVFLRSNIEMQISRNAEDVYFVNNAACIFVFILPFVFLFRHKKVLSLILLSVLLVFVIAGSKRGAVISAIVGSLIYVYFLLKSIGENKKYLLRSYLLTFIGITVFLIFIYQYFQSNELLISRLSSMAEGDSSGRDVIYYRLFNTWLNSNNLINILFGFGYTSSIQSSGGLFAHNDWLELLTSFGLTGVVVYIVMFYAAIKFAINKKIRIDKRIMMMALVSIWFITSAVSMNYAAPEGVFQTILLAHLFGTKEHYIFYQKQFSNENTFI